MTILINSTHIINSAGADFFLNYLLNITVAKPEHQFIFITSAAIDDQLISSKNITQVITSTSMNSILVRRFWLNYKLPGIARKYKADLIINTGEECSLKTKVPQWIFVSDLSFLNFPGFFSKKQLHYFKKNMAAFLDKANKIVAASDFITKEIIKEYSIDKNKISLFSLTASDLYQPADWKEKEATREKYAAGKEYFLFTGEIHPRSNLVILLKAFSFFKKRQKSNMQLIITTKTIPAKNSFNEILKTYKYRKEVILLTDLPEKELAKITAATYAFLYPVLYDGMALFPLQAMQCEVPVITSRTGALVETTGDAALYADPADFEDIADKMMLVFKDENKRSELIKMGKLIVQKNENVKTEDFWNYMIKTILS